MASNDSGVDTSNDSNDSVVAVGLPPLALPVPGLSSIPPAPPVPPPPPAPPAPPPLLLLSLASQQFGQQSVNLSASVYENQSQHDLVRKICTRLRPRGRSKCHYLDSAKERHLRLAASTCNIELLTKLLESGTNPNCRDEHFRSPLHLASCRGYADIVSQLLKYGANPNIVDSLDNTPLHLAVISASSDSFNLVVKILLQAGANLCALDRSGKNPLQLAHNKLRLLRSRCTNPTSEMRKILRDMYSLILEMVFHSRRNRNKSSNDLILLEESLEKLNMKNNDTDDTSNLDNLFSKLEDLTIT